MSEHPADAAGAAPVRPPPTGIPPALVIALATMLVTGVVLELLFTYVATTKPDFGSDGWMVQFLTYSRGLVWSGSTLAVAALTLVGMLELARRAGPGVDGTALRVAAGFAGVLLVLALARAYANYWWYPRGEMTKERLEAFRSFWTWQARFLCVAATGVSVALVVAGRRISMVLALAAPLVIVTVLQHPPLKLYDWLSFEQPNSDVKMWLQAGIDIAVRAGFVGCMVAVLSALGTALPPASIDMVRAGQGLERVGSGLVARVIVILVTLFTVIMTVGAQSPSMARVAGVIFPSCLLIAGVAIVTGLIQAGGLAAAGAPRLRLYAGAALTITAMTIDALKAISLYLALRRGETDEYAVENVQRVATALPYFSPALGLAGLLCALSGAARLRRMVPDARVDEAGINAAAASVIIFTASAMALLRWAQSGVSSPGLFVMVSVVIAIANIIAQLSVARVCHRVGAAMREVSSLPPAVASVK